MGRWSVRRGAREGHGTRLEVRAFWGRLCCAESDTLAAPGGDQESISAKDSIFFSYFFVFPREDEARRGDEDVEGTFVLPRESQHHVRPSKARASFFEVERLETFAHARVEICEAYSIQSPRRIERKRNVPCHPSFFCVLKRSHQHDSCSAARQKAKQASGV